MPKHVLVVARWYPSHDSPISGIFVADLVRALVGAGHDVVVASFEALHLRGAEATRGDRADRAAAAWAAAVARPDALSTPTAWGAGVPVARLPISRTWGAGGELDEVNWVDRHGEILLPFGRSLARRWPIDVIHAQTGLPDGLAADRLAAELGVPLLVSEHDSTLPARLAAKPAVAAWYGTLADAARRRAIATVSPALAGRIRAAAGGDLRLHELPNPVDLSAFPTGLRAGRRADELLFVGTRSEHKGTSLLLAAFAEVHRLRPSWRLRLIGRPAGGDDSPWRARASELGLTDAVSFEPQASRVVVAEAMRRASIFVHPSPWETFGVVAAEALGSGLPVAATPSGGVESIVGDDGRLGRIAAGHDPASLTAAILAVADALDTFDPEFLRASIAERFGPDRIATAATALYDGLLAAPAPAPATGPPGPRPELAPPGPAAASTIVVGLHPNSFARLNALPAPTLAGLPVVTGPGDLETGIGVAGVAGTPIHLELDADAPYRRQRAATGGPLGFLRRRRLFRRRVQMQASERRRVMLESVAAATTPRATDPSPPLIVAVDVDDLLTAVDVAGPLVMAAPGSLRWLADRHDAISSAVAPSTRALLGD